MTQLSQDPGYTFEKKEEEEQKIYIYIFINEKLTKLQLLFPNSVYTIWAQHILVTVWARYIP